MVIEALKTYGLKEFAGASDNPELLAMAKEINVKEYTHDSIAWCGFIVSVWAKRSGWPYKPQGNPLWAANWGTWERGVKVAMLGDVLVSPRKGGNHVCLYVGEDDTHYHCLGGNQSNAVSIVRKPKANVQFIRRPNWKVAQPKDVRRIVLTADGQLAGSEA